MSMSTGDRLEDVRVLDTEGREIRLGALWQDQSSSLDLSSQESAPLKGE